jgi:hypothetical protein
MIISVIITAALIDLISLQLFCQSNPSSCQQEDNKAYYYYSGNDSDQEKQVVSWNRWRSHWCFLWITN